MNLQCDFGLQRKTEGDFYIYNLATDQDGDTHAVKFRDQVGLKLLIKANYNLFSFYEHFAPEDPESAPSVDFSYSLMLGYVCLVPLSKLLALEFCCLFTYSIL